MSNEWIACEWQRAADADAFELGVTIRRQTSPDYEGVKFSVNYGDMRCLTKRGKMIYQPRPSARTKEFFKRCRFDSFESAVAAADKYLENRGKKIAR